MSRKVVETRTWLDRLQTAAGVLGAPVQFMEVCGTHTVAAFRCGLHSLMPANVKLLSGPGCPVCVTAQGDIDQFIEVADRPGVTICTYGDMMRVNGSAGSMEKARGRGADIRIVYSAMDAVKLAAAEPQRQVVLAAVGFETTTPATAIAAIEAHRLKLTNFTVLVSHKCIMPAMRALLDSGTVNVQGFLCPGHVAVILGYEVFRPIVEEYGLPCAIAGFEDAHIAAGLAKLTEMVRDGEPRLENLYPQAVTANGNARAQAVIARVFEPADMRWRGLGMLPASGLKLRSEFAGFDAKVRFRIADTDTPEPPGCRCGEVITGRCTPADCRLFAKTCTPVNAIGPCMVSSEGTCQAWFKYKRAGSKS